MSGIAEVLKGQGWILPDGYQPDNIARCRSCQAEILWCITQNRRKAPTNRDGTSHFSTCPAAEQWRRRDEASDRTTAGKRVLVAVLNRDGSQRAVLTYMAPDDAAIGDVGRVEMWVREERRNYLFDARITGLTSDYTGPCKAFVRLAKAAPGEIR